MLPSTAQDDTGTVRAAEPRLVPLGEGLAISSSRYRQEIHYWQQLIDSLPAIVWVSDEAGNTLFFNARWYAYTGQEFGELRQDEWAKALHPDERDAVDAHWFATVNAYRSDYAATFRLRRHDGVYRHYLCRAAPLATGPGWIGFCTEVPRGVEING